VNGKLASPHLQPNLLQFMKSGLAGTDRGRSVPEFEEAADRGDEARIIAFYEADPTLLHATEYLLTPLHRAVSLLSARM
jgi:hypothetical protein